jgi:K+-transporting ATPase ATPase A chain
MTTANWLQFIGFILLVCATAPPLGFYIARVYEGGPSRLDRVFNPIERFIYRLCRIDHEREQRWNVYTISLLAFSVVAVLVLYLQQRIQDSLPFNPTNLGNVVPTQAFETTISFVTNTNWQSYYPETTMSYLTQMTGLTVQMFVSAAVGMAVMAALIRGLTRHGTRTLGNFWVDLVRTNLRILLPIAFVFAFALGAAGVVQNFKGFESIQTVAGAEQEIPGGPVASQVAIKQVGTNGGGFYNTNSATPFENSTPVSNFLELYAIVLIPFALAFTFGRMARQRRQGLAVFAIMMTIFLAANLLTVFFEVNGNPNLDRAGADQTVTAESPGGNLEGKELRFGPTGSAIWAASTTGTSNGSVNSMHDSYTPLGGMVPLVHMKLGEVSPGGVGVGLNGLLVMVILSVFIAGLMVGRTPEYLGKKIQAPEIKLVVLYILAMPVAVLGFLALAAFVQSVTSTTIYNPGPHGFTEITYAYTSAGNNNGSAFAGITANTQWMNTTLGFAMLIGRFMLIIPTMAIAGSLARKGRVAPSVGTFPTDTALFVLLVVGVILVVGALVFLPVLALGPLVEQLGT